MHIPSAGTLAVTIAMNSQQPHVCTSILDQANLLAHRNFNPLKELQKNLEIKEDSNYLTVECATVRF